MTTITEEADLSSSLEQKIKLATEGFIDHYVNLLRRQSESNIEIICDYILAMNAEINPVPAYKKNQMQILCYLSEYCSSSSSSSGIYKFISNNNNDNISIFFILR